MQSDGVGSNLIQVYPLDIVWPGNNAARLSLGFRLNISLSEV